MANHMVEGSPAEERGESSLVEKAEVRAHIDASNARHKHTHAGHSGTRHTAPGSSELLGPNGSSGHSGGYGKAHRR